MAIDIKGLVRQDSEQVRAQYATRSGSAECSLSMVNGGRNGKRFQFSKGVFVPGLIDPNTIVTKTDKNGRAKKFAPIQMFADVTARKLYIGQNLDESLKTFIVSLTDQVLYSGPMIEAYTRFFGLKYGEHVSLSFSGSIETTPDGKKMAVFDMHQTGFLPSDEASAPAETDEGDVGSDD